jgi:hypothetical protein
VAVQANTEQVPIMSVRWSVQPSANERLYLPSDQSPALLEQLAAASGQDQQQETRLVVAVCGAGRECPSPACRAAHGIYPGIGVTATKDDKVVTLHRDFAAAHSGAGASSNVILNLGEVAASDGSAFSGAALPNVLVVGVHMAKQAAFTESCMKSKTAKSKLPCRSQILCQRALLWGLHVFRLLS